MIAWSTIQTALQAFVVAGSGLSASKVIWAQQEGDRPTGPYATLRISNLRAIGSDWYDVEDAEVTEEEPEPEPGEEIVLKLRGVREATLTIQAYGGGVQATSPVARLETVIAALPSPTRQAALDAAGVSVLRFGDVKSLDGILGSSYEARAIVEATISLTSEVDEATTFIEQVELQRVDEDGDALEDEIIVPDED